MIKIEVTLTTHTLADDVLVSKDLNDDGTKRVVVNTLKLGALRQPGNEINDERLEIRWLHNGREQSQFDDQFEIDADVGQWLVTVRLITSEVRIDPNNLLSDMEHFAVTQS